MIGSLSESGVTSIGMLMMGAFSLSSIEKVSFSQGTVDPGHLLSLVEDQNQPSNLRWHVFSH